MDTHIKSLLKDLVLHLETIVPYASALYKKSQGMRINVNKLQEAIEPENPAKGFVFTIWNGQRFFEYATNNLEGDSLKNDLSQWAKAAMAGVNKGQPTSNIDPGASVDQHFSISPSKDPGIIPLKEKLALAKENLNVALKADPLVSNVFSILGHVHHTDIYINRYKTMSQDIVRSDLILMAFLSDGKRSCEIFHGLSKNGGLDKVQMPKEEITGFVRDGKRLLEAKRLTPGTYDVVTDPEWSGIIAHECFGHGMETDLYVRERALSHHYLGKPIASSIVNMFDDPSLIGEAGGFFFDDEGEPSHTTHIIKDGILQRGLTDLASSHKLNMSRSANGRRESYARKAYARMTNTFFANGQSSPADILSSVQNGIYLRYATNGMEDPQAWGIQVEGLWAEEIKNGKLTGKIYSPVIMTGFVPDLLQSISMVGNDGHISGLGMCGKGHKEWVKNTTGGPHLKMKARLG